MSNNFGKAEASRLRKDKASWSCYACAPTPAFSRLQEATRRNRERMFSLEDVYRQVHAPADILQQSQQEQLRIVRALSPQELRLASIFTDMATNSVYKSANIADYLQASSLLMLRCLSRNLRSLFLLLDLAPGLFKTRYGEEHACQLHPHQMASLASMRDMENRRTTFGAVRGGVLADAPGLGKTVTMLALITSTAGTLPRIPAPHFSVESLSAAWRESAPSLEVMVRPLFNNLRRIVGHDDDLKKLFVHTFTQQTQAAVLQQFPSVQSFEKRVVQLLRSKLYGGTLDHALECVRIGMVSVREGLDKGSRGFLASKKGVRMRREQQLRGSSATLIIVPLSLLEHWFEQISRHLGLGYFCNDGEEMGMRGAVYFDCMGDIVDVTVPLRKTATTSNIGVSVEQLSQYAIVVTTFERCAKEHDGFFTERGPKGCYDYNESLRPMETSVLAKIRWLRLVVDEGHELGLHTSESPAVAFIQSLAAERRWVCSGTPTVGTNSGRALVQLLRQLLFLRHEEFGCSVDGERRWAREVVEPFVRGSDGALAARDKVVEMLRSLMIRHTKEDLRLHDPIRLSVVVSPLPDPRDYHDDETRWVDRALAAYVCDVLRLRREERNLDRRARRPKFIVFSREKHNLQGMAHYLYLRLGDAELCEHFGAYRSSELSRFRHSLRKFRVCPMCGFENSITSGDCCEKKLILVEYRRDLKLIEDPSWDGTAAGKYTGRCLCSHEGCTERCAACRPNALHTYSSGNSALEVIAEEHIQGYTSGHQYFPGQQISVLPQSAAASAGGPLLWRDRGRCGGIARVVQWLPCGGRGTTRSFHNDRLLVTAPWQTIDEGASVMLLEEDGSTGLDLSFVTDIFLLERIEDPALESQVISRAHRMGAEGPVTVTLVEVSDTADFKAAMEGGQKQQGEAVPAE